MSLLSEAMDLTWDEINKLPTEDLEKYVKVMGNKINTQIHKYVESKQFKELHLENAPLYSRIMKGGLIKTDITKTSENAYLRQELMSEFARARDILNLKTFTITDYKNYRRYLKNNFMKNAGVNRKLTYKQVDKLASIFNKTKELVGESNYDIYKLKTTVEILDKKRPELTNDEFIKKLEKLPQAIYKMYKKTENIPEFKY